MKESRRSRALNNAVAEATTARVCIRADDTAGVVIRSGQTVSIVLTPERATALADQIIDAVEAAERKNRA